MQMRFLFRVFLSCILISSTALAVDSNTEEINQEFQPTIRSLLAILSTSSSTEEMTGAIDFLKEQHLNVDDPVSLSIKHNKIFIGGLELKVNSSRKNFLLDGTVLEIPKGRSLDQTVRYVYARLKPSRSALTEMVLPQARADNFSDAKKTVAVATGAVAAVALSAGGYIYLLGKTGLIEGELFHPGAGAEILLGKALVKIGLNAAALGTGIEVALWTLEPSKLGPGEMPQVLLAHCGCDSVVLNMKFGQTFKIFDPHPPKPPRCVSRAPYNETSGDIKIQIFKPDGTEDKWRPYHNPWTQQTLKTYLNLCLNEDSAKELTAQTGYFMNYGKLKADAHTAPALKSSVP